MTEETISVIVPVYNVEAYLEKCVRSVLAQSCGDFELLLIDDGSKDGSGAVCDRLAAEDERIRVIHQENRGLAAARNRGLGEAKGGYIIFLDSDDYWDGGVLEALRDGLKAAGAGIALFPLLYVDEEGKALPSPEMPKPDRYTRDEILHLLCHDGSVQLVTAVNRLSEKRLWKTLRFPEGRYHEDEFTAHRLFAACPEFVLLERPYYYYVQRGGSITRTDSPERFLDRVDAFLDRAVFLEELGRKEDVPPTLKRAMHWYLLMLSEIPVRSLKNCAHWPEISERFRQGLVRYGWQSLFGRKETLAVKRPGLWQSLHRLRHGGK